jgi:hypothetical protein
MQTKTQTQTRTQALQAQTPQTQATRTQAMRTRAVRARVAGARVGGIARCGVVRCGGLLVVLGLLTLGVLVSSAFAEGECVSCRAWWHLASDARPSNLHAAGVRVSEVQEIRVTATGGSVYVAEQGGVEEVLSGVKELGQLTHVEFAFDATPAEAQTALEGLYGAGNVEVSAGAGGAGSYRVTASGALAGGSLKGERLNTELGFLASPELEGEAVTTQLVEGKSDGTIVVDLANSGDANASGGTVPVRVADSLPAGFRATSIEALRQGISPVHLPECSLKTVSCQYAGVLTPYAVIEVRVGVDVEEPAAVSGALNEATVSGGEGFLCKAGIPGCEHVPVGAVAPVSIRRALTVSSAVTPFGLEYYELDNENEGGSADTQAGSHPFQQTTSFALNQTVDARAAAVPKDLSFKWPPGLIGNPTAVARCTIKAFAAKPKPTCPLSSVVGVATVTINEPGGGGVVVLTEPLFNLEPEVGEPARFGFTPNGVPVFIDPAVRSGGDYGITVHAYNITQSIAFLSSEVTVWGVPGDARHDPARGYGCLGSVGNVCSLPEHSPPAFLALPTSCPRNPATGQPERFLASAEGDSWLEPKPVGQLPLLASFAMPAVDGCNRLPFTPSIRVTPDSEEGSRPTGLKVDVHVPQEESVNGEGLAEADPRDITVALPQGVAINPAGGDGLQACSEGLVGFKDSEELSSQPGTQTDTFTPTLPGSVDALADGESEPLQPGINFCADASKIATATIKTPILPNPIEGAVYLAQQESNPFGSLVAMYIVAEDPVSGVLVKLAGQVHLTESGQIVTTFENSPQAPFEDAELHFFGGERAPLASPAHCGTYTASASFTPWTAEPGAAPLPSSSSFKVTSGPNGQPCPGSSLPFAPTLTAGSTSIQAGGFTPFTTTMSREDGQQSLSSIELKMPEGLSGLLAGVELCPEPKANQGLCGPNSLIGETTVSVGLGGDPFTVTGGKVYITGPYKGAPFGLSIVNPAKAGPYDLAHTQANHPPCDCVLVRAKIQVNPITAALTVTSDSEGPYKIPTILEGIPLQIKHVNVTINRPGFTFNPTNCNKLEIAGNLLSAEGASQALSVPFQATNCAILKFTPKIAVATAAQASKNNGASLKFTIGYPAGAIGSQSWFQEAKFDLPKQLPARLTTLQKACLSTVFEANRANCPKGSKIGTAIVHTPVLPVPLTGPVYFVSYGGAKFPEAVLVLEGYGITIDLHGETFISKQGITSATFRNTPDVPFQNIEVTIPTGPNSEFSANLPPKDHYNFCGQKLQMPTLFKAQNGQEIHQTTPITITGCHKPKKPTKHTHKKPNKHK